MDIAHALRHRRRAHLLVLLVVAVAVAIQALAPEPAPAPGVEAIEAAYREGRSGVAVEVEGRVAKLLRDDQEGSRHQRFLLDVGLERRLLVAHNIDLAPRVPLDVGDTVLVRGVYEHDPRGGVVHWTHHDPQGRHPGGFIRHGGRRYE